jgi:hypothetical protein
MDNLEYGFGHAEREDVYDLAADSRAEETWYEQDHGYRPSADPVGMHVTGTQLRRRLITPEAIAAIHAEQPKKSLMQGLLGRVRKRG